MTVAVVGSINRDLVVEVERFPLPGETVRASGLRFGHGGKGANQATGVALLGRSVSLIGRVGADDSGADLLAVLDRDGVNVEGVTHDDAEPSGTAIVMVDASGENAIIAGPGANGRVAVEDVEARADVVRNAAVVLLQLEIPLEAVVAAASMAEGVVVLNPAPASPLPPKLLAAVDVLVPNCGELEALTGSPDPASASGLEIPATVVTLGAGGAAIVDASGLEVIPAPHVGVVDTTGAGDAFCAALADGLAGEADLRGAVLRAVAAGALATTALGARSALPTRADLERFLMPEPPR